MGRTGQRIAIAAATAGAIVCAGLVANAQATDDGDRVACHEAIRLAEEMANVNAERVGTMGARSAALRMGWQEKVDELTPKHLALVAEYQSLHLAFREAAARC